MLITAFILRAAFLMAVGTNPTMYLTPDSSVYLRLAENMKSLRIFSSNEPVPNVPDTIRTPGYPAFLMLFGDGQSDSILRIVWAQALLGALTAGLLFLAGSFLWPKPDGAGLFAGLGMAFDYVIVLYSAFVMTEPLFLPIFVLSLLFYGRFLLAPDNRTTSLVLSGLFYGLGALVRPVSLYYFLVPASILIYMGVTKKIMKPAKTLALFLLVAVTLPCLWMARNKAVAGAWTFTTIQGVTRAAILEERLSGTTFEESCTLLEERFKREHPAGFKNATVEASAKSVWSMKYVLSHPKDYAIVLLQETIRLIGGNGMKAGAWMFFKDPNYDPFTIVVHPTESNSQQIRTLWNRHPVLGIALSIYLSLLALVYLMAVTGFFTVWKENRVVALWLGMTVAYFFLVSIGFGTGARYRIPIMPAIFLLAGIGFSTVRAWTSGRSAAGNSHS